MTFHGASRADEKVIAHIHESPKIMLLPLFVLAAGSIAGGFIGYDVMISNGDFWGQSIFVALSHHALENVHHVPLWVKGLPLAVAALGIAIAYLFYIRCPYIPEKIS